MRLRIALVCVGVVLLLSSIAFASGSNDYRSGATILNRNEVEQASVCYPYDTVDWWKVYIPESGALVVFLDGVQERDIDLYLYDGSENLLAKSNGRGEDEVVYGRVAGGYYYIKVQVSFESTECADYDLGALFTDSSSGYLRRTKDINFHCLYMSSSRVYWIFLYDRDGFFDPDLFLVYGDKIRDKSQSTKNLDVIKRYPEFSGDYTIAVGSAQGSGYYYLLIGSKSR